MPKELAQCWDVVVVIEYQCTQVSLQTTQEQHRRTGTIFGKRYNSYVDALLAVVVSKKYACLESVSKS